MSNRILTGLTALSIMIGCASTGTGSHGTGPAAHGGPGMNCRMAGGQGHEGMAHGAGGGAGMQNGDKMMHGDKTCSCPMKPQPSPASSSGTPIPVPSPISGQEVAR